MNYAPNEFKLDPAALWHAGQVLQESLGIQAEAFAVRSAIATLIQQCNGAATAAGWNYKPRSVPLRMMLVVSEIAEAMEGHRNALMDDKLPHRKMLEVELADTAIRICDMAGQENFRIGEAAASLCNRAWTLAGGYHGMPVPDRLFRIVQTIASAGENAGPLGICNVRTADGTPLTFCELHLAHALQQIGWLCQDEGLDLGGAIAEKMQFNQVREDHKPEARAAAGGKAY